MIFIGIDTGVKTGLAVWSSRSKRFVEISTCKIHEAMRTVRQYQTAAEAGFYSGLLVRVEDARLRKWYGNRSEAKRQGAGSVKRDAKIWEDYLTDIGVSFELCEPQKGLTKVDAQQFKLLTKWTERTSSHSRDAALLVFNSRR